jgi:phosphotriesterase-related protein
LDVKSSAEKISDFFCSEIEDGLTETREQTCVKAGFIKIALEADWANCPQAALEGAADAAYRTKKMIEIHTEKGELAQEIVRYFWIEKITPVQIVLCHMDKKPDLTLHQDLVQQGVLLEYDTFYRPKYDPEKNLWPLLDKMVQSGCAASVSLATDMADPAFYHHIGNGAGLASLPREIQAQLIERGFSQGDRRMLLGRQHCQAPGGDSVTDDSIRR